MQCDEENVLSTTRSREHAASIGSCLHRNVHFDGDANLVPKYRSIGSNIFVATNEARFECGVSFNVVSGGAVVCRKA